MKVSQRTSGTDVAARTFADPAQQSNLQIDNEFGLTVTQVQKDSAAATAELRKFDVLMEFNGSIW